MPKSLTPATTPPLVSVILPVFNAGPYLAEAIESILRQTLADLELFVIDDCSTDNSLAVARHYEAQDPRVKVLVNDSNRGRAYSDNRGHALASGRYIAKMDADDVARPYRLQMQYEFLEKHADVALTSSHLQTFGATNMVFRYPVSADEVRSFLLFNMPVGNPAAFFRRTLLTAHDLRYDEAIKETFGEDYEWVARVAQVATIVNQPEILLNYRTFPASVKADYHARRTAKANQIRERVLRQAGFTFNAQELHLHNTIAQYPFVLGGLTLAQVHEWLLSIDAQNRRLAYAAPDTMRRVLAERWFWTCYHNPDRSTDNYRQYYQHELGRDFQPPGSLRGRLWLKNSLLWQLIKKHDAA